MRSRLCEITRVRRAAGSCSSSGSSARAGSPACPGSRARTRGCCGCRRRGSSRSTGPGRRPTIRFRCSPASSLQQDVLRVVRVLVLVDEDVAERLRPALARLGEALQHVDGQHQQVVEVDRVRGEQAALVEARRRRRRSGRRSSRRARRTRPGRSAGSSRSRSACGCRAGRSASGRARAPRGTALTSRTWSAWS